MSKIEVGKTYPTRDGKLVRILATDLKYTQPVVGAILYEDGTELVSTFGADGMYCSNNAEDKFDIIMPEPERKMIEAGKTYPLRGGLTARIGFTDKKGPRPISGLVDAGEHEFHQTWYADGRAWGCEASDYDIVMPEPERKSLWSNFYNSDGRPKMINLERVLETRALADKYALPSRTHVLEIITENGEPVDVKIHKVER